MCNACLTKAKTFDLFQSQMKESVNYINSNTQMKRMNSESPKIATKKTPFQYIINTAKSQKTLFKVKSSNKVIVHKVHSSMQIHDRDKEVKSVVIYAFLSIFLSFLSVGISIKSLGNSFQYNSKHNSNSNCKKVTGSGKNEVTETPVTIYSTLELSDSYCFWPNPSESEGQSRWSC